MKGPIPNAAGAALLLCIVLTAGCTTQQPGVYRGGVLVQPGPLAADKHYSYRFVDKWRISHRWLSGPVDLKGCWGYSANPFRLKGFTGELAKDENAPFLEDGQKLTNLVEHKGRWFLAPGREFFYGTNREGEFRSYMPVCREFFRDTLDFVSLFIVEPDPAKGTDAWIAGATPVTLHGLKWLHKDVPIQDWSNSRERLAAPIEYWVLPIPQTRYWLALIFSSSESASPGMGANIYPDKHRYLLQLFHEIVDSVTLEPITPVDIGYLLDAPPKK